MADPSAQQYPNLNPYTAPNGASSTSPNGSPATATEHGKSILNNAQQTAAATANDIKNSQVVQDIANGPVAQKAANEAAATKTEFGNLAASRQTPSTQTATGQNLTHYHSFFYNLLSWENPRATAISYATIVLAVLAFRYVPVAKYALKALYIVLGLTAAAEIAGKMILNQGVATKLRPKKYYVVPQETLESIIVDAVELANFFVIEFQRVVFAENVYATVAAFASAFLSYWLIKIMPSWGLFLFFTTVIYFGPLVYINNQELIDEQLGNAHKIVAEQTTQVRALASENASKAWQATQSATKQYSAKASEAIGQASAKTQGSFGQASAKTSEALNQASAKASEALNQASAKTQESVGQASAKTQETLSQTEQAAVDKGYVSSETAEKVTPSQTTTAEEVTPQTGVTSADFPAAPKQEPAVTEVVDPTAELPTESHAEGNKEPVAAFGP